MFTKCSKNWQQFSQWLCCVCFQIDVTISNHGTIAWERVVKASGAISKRGSWKSATLSPDSVSTWFHIHSFPFLIKTFITCSENMNPFPVKYDILHTSFKYSRKCQKRSLLSPSEMWKLKEHWPISSKRFMSYQMIWKFGSNKETSPVRNKF